jgi:hypothetical protein
MIDGIISHYRIVEKLCGDLPRFFSNALCNSSEGDDSTKKIQEHCWYHFDVMPSGGADDHAKDCDCIPRSNAPFLPQKMSTTRSQASCVGACVTDST